MRAGTKEFEVERRDGKVVLTLNEDAAAGLALILETYELRQIERHQGFVTWGDLVADIRTAR